MAQDHDDAESEKNRKMLDLYTGLMAAIKAADVNPELEAIEDVKINYLNICLFCAILLNDLEKVNEAIDYGADVNCCYDDYQQVFTQMGITRLPI
tara:strand:- start:1781 stop:2065 length:285 start_codon:yes stop_codon:yes gene_type:complete